jgi:glycerol-3-phosphate dehydrogenase (NAD(P)+)
MSKIGVIGGGKWGQALHFALSQKQQTLITSRRYKEEKEFVDLDTLLGCTHIIIALPAQITRVWLEKNFTFNGQKVLVASKGIEAESGKFLNEIYSEFLPDEHLAFISGPSFAAEVIKGLPTALVINSTNLELAEEFGTFFPDFIKTYVSNDVIGAEVAGAYKNVLAIAGGICEGLQLGNNAKASMISRGLVEMQRFGEHFGAHNESFVGLSGAGDLFLTASSRLSRNFRVGLGLAQGEALDTILQELGEVAEGVFTAKAIAYISQKEHLYTPIAHEVHEILGGKDPLESLKDLLRS